MGFGPDRIEEINPRLIVASVNGYGSIGPYAERPSFDFIAQAMSGFMGRDRRPRTASRCEPVPRSETLVAGLYAAFGVACALHARGAGTGPEAAAEAMPETPLPTGAGAGQYVETSLMGGLVSMLAYVSAEYFATGPSPGTERQRSPPSSSPTACSRGATVTSRWLRRTTGTYAASSG